MVPDLAVIIPCHNEAETLPGVLARLGSAKELDGFEVELVLVENGSSDETLALARAALVAGVGRFAVTVLSLPVGDYGAAVRTGISASQSRMLAVLDCDMVDLGFVTHACRLLEEDASLGAVLASKLVAGSDDRRSLYRRTGSRVFSALVRMLVGSTLTDTHGNKVLRGVPARRFAREVAENGSLFDTELLLRMERARWRIGETPTTVTESRPPRSSYLSRVPGTLRGLWRLRRRFRDEEQAEHDR